MLRKNRAKVHSVNHSCGLLFVSNRVTNATGVFCMLVCYDIKRWFDRIMDKEWAVNHRRPCRQDLRKVWSRKRSLKVASSSRLPGKRLLHRRWQVEILKNCPGRRTRKCSANYPAWWKKCKLSQWTTISFKS